MSITEYIEHEAWVKEVRSGELVLGINSTSACAQCHAKSFCSPSSESKEKTIVIHNPTLQCREGEKIFVGISNRQGMRAVVLSYFIPFVVLLCTLVITQKAWKNELWSGLLALVAVSVYFFVLYFFRNTLSKQIDFHLRK